LNAKIVLWIFGDFGLRDTYQERIAPKLIKIDMDKLHIKFLALNVDYDGPKISLDFSGSRKPAHGSTKERYPVVILPFLVSFSWKLLQITMIRPMLSITTSTSNDLFSRITIVDFERPWTS